jgi:hypothetical protein
MLFRDGTLEAAPELPPSMAPPRLERLEKQAEGRGERRKAVKKLFEYSTPY